MKRQVDHIVYCVPNLKEAVDYFDSLLGIRPVIGGNHPSKGTKNALLNLGDKCYLEILAIDHNNHKVKGNRWMGIDLIKEPKITRWSLKSHNLDKDSRILSRQTPDLGIVNTGSRYTSDGRLLSWKMILPTSTPEVEILPFMTDWSESDSHPTDNLQAGCSLQTLQLLHPFPNRIQSTISELGLNIIVEQNDIPEIVILINSPNGLKEIR